MGGTPAKTALGRGLRRLMRGPGEPKRNGSSAAAPSISPGVARLLRGGLDAFEEPPSTPLTDPAKGASNANPRGIEASLQTTLPTETSPAPEHYNGGVTAVNVTGASAAATDSGPDGTTPASFHRPQKAPLPTFGANEVVAWRRLVQGSLIGADLLLAGMAAWLAFSPSHPFGLVEGLICVLALLAGCWLTALALFLEP